MSAQYLVIADRGHVKEVCVAYESLNDATDMCKRFMHEAALLGRKDSYIVLKAEQVPCSEISGTAIETLSMVRGPSYYLFRQSCIEEDVNWFLFLGTFPSKEEAIDAMKKLELHMENTATSVYHILDTNELQVVKAVKISTLPLI